MVATPAMTSPQASSSLQPYWLIALKGHRHLRQPEAVGEALAALIREFAVFPGHFPEKTEIESVEYLPQVLFPQKNCKPGHLPSYCSGNKSSAIA